MAKRSITIQELQCDGAPPPSMSGIIGDKFGMLTVLSFAGRRVLRPRVAQFYVFCQCDCGREVLINGCHLRHGRIKSCGCAKGYFVSKSLMRHGHALARSRVYQTWGSMLNRCRHESNKEYHRYGGRGIIVCERWQGRNGFQNFMADMGEPSAGDTIERINNDGNYEPSNCKWIPRAAQMWNTSSVWRVDWHGEIIPASECASVILCTCEI